MDAGVPSPSWLLEFLAPRCFSESEVKAVIVNSIGWAPSPELVTAVHRRTEGNPFFVTELVRLLDARGTLGGRLLTSEVPLRVREVVRRRVTKLPVPTAELLVLASVA